jgi:hypothetical protein
MRSKLAVVAGMLAATMAITGPAAAKGPRTELDFLGQAIVATGTTFEGTTVGGLSSITYDARPDLFYAISDDPGQFQPTRFYTIALDLGDGGLQDGDVRFVDVTTLLAPDGSPYAPFSLDPEGLALTKDRELIFTSEGIAARVVDPFVRRYRLDGSFAGSLFVPQDFLPNAEGTRGVRQNLGFESAGVPPNGRFAFVATENALVQDGPAATLSGGSRARIGVRDGSGRRAACPFDPVLGQRAGRAASAQQLAPDRDGALVLRRRAWDGQHDQALRRGFDR